MIRLYVTSKVRSTRAYLALSCAVSVLTACSPGGSTSNTAADASNASADNSLADAAPPATALPLATGPAPAASPAPVASALPAAPSAPLGHVPQGDQYAYLNQAYDFSQSLADAPPDYSYDYQGERPWVWQSPDGHYRVAERLPSGVRYFYYAPGASTPYLVQDPQYSYAYSQGYLAAVYGPGGEVLPYEVETRQSREAGVYLAWAAGLYAAARHEQHVAVSQARWDAERQTVYADQARWNAAQQRNAAWAAYSQAHQADQAHWAAQRYARAAEAARFAQTVNDPNALARAQQAASEARTVAQGHGERLPGPTPAAGGFAGRDETAAGAPRERGPRSPFEGPPQGRPPVEARDQAAARAGVGGEPPRQAERPNAAQNAGAQNGGAQNAAAQHAAAQNAAAQNFAQRAAEIRAEHETQAAANRQAAADGHEAQAQAHQAAGRPAEASVAAQRAAGDRAEADAHRLAAAQAAAQARPPEAPAVQARRPAEPQARAPSPQPPPHPGAPPAKPKPRPEPPQP